MISHNPSLNGGGGFDMVLHNRGIWQSMACLPYPLYTGYVMASIKVCITTFFQPGAQSDLYHIVLFASVQNTRSKTSRLETRFLCNMFKIFLILRSLHLPLWRILWSLAWWKVLPSRGGNTQAVRSNRENQSPRGAFFRSGVSRHCISSRRKKNRQAIMVCSVDGKWARGSYLSLPIIDKLTVNSSLFRRVYSPPRPS